MATIFWDCQLGPETFGPYYVCNTRERVEKSGLATAVAKYLLTLLYCVQNDSRDISYVHG
jgi:hypothetical protein